MAARSLIEPHLSSISSPGLSASGIDDGSLVYADVLVEPEHRFFQYSPARDQHSLTPPPALGAPILCRRRP